MKRVDRGIGPQILQAALAVVTAGVLAGAAPAPGGFGGGGVGNHFVHRVEASFDFHIAHPPEWAFEKQESSEGLHSWRISNWKIIDDPERESWLKMDFKLDLEVEGTEELRERIEELHPDIQWKPLPGPIAGFTSGDRTAGPHATTSLEYYFMDESQVVKLRTRKDDYDDSSGAEMVAIIHETIDRASAPPKIESIETRGESGRTGFRIGETVCYWVEMDVLKGAFDENGVTEFRTASDLEHWKERSVEWKGDENRFEICQEITQAMGPQGLSIERLSVQNRRGQVVNCKGLENILFCNETRRIQPSIGTVSNPNPDRAGPEFESLRLNQGANTLQLDVADRSGLQGAEVRVKNAGRVWAVTVFPDQLKGGRHEIGFGDSLEPGWFRLDYVTLFDKNGFTTLLRHPSLRDGSHDCPGETPEDYDLITHDGDCRRSGISIVSFLVREDSL